MSSRKRNLLSGGPKSVSGTAAPKKIKLARHEVVQDSNAKDEEEIFVKNSAKSQRNKRTPKQAGLDEGLGEMLKAVKKNKISTPTSLTTTTTSLNDLRNESKPATIRSSPPGKRFQKKGLQPNERISIKDMNVWTGN